MARPLHAPTPSDPSASTAAAGQPDAGVDVSKPWLDADIWPRTPAAARRVPNNDRGCADLVDHLRRLGVRRVAIEATGGYEWRIVDALRDAGLDVRVVNPKRIRDYARGLGVLAKTDQIDAWVLARYAGELDEQGPDLLNHNQRHRDQLVTRRRQLVAMRTMELNHLEHTPAGKLRQQVQRVIDLLDKQVAEVEKLIEESITSDPAAHAIDQSLKTVDGIGPTTSRMLITELPQIGRASRRQITALAGLAPYNDDSGPRRGARRIQGGRANLRSALFMPTLAATVRNPVIRDYYQRLRAAGKAHFSAMVAAMRKLLIHLNTLARSALNNLKPSEQNP